MIILIIFLMKNDYISEGFSSDEAVQNVASLYNTGMATVTNLRATKDINVDGILTSNHIRNPGRMHLSGDELLYLLNKNGVIIGKEWGGNGNLSVQGDCSVAGTATVNQLMANKITAHSDILTNRIQSNVDISTGNLNVSGRAKFRTMAGVRAADGWDISQPRASDINSCINACLPIPTALTAMWQRNNNTCYCKSNTQLYPNKDNNYDTAIII